MSRMGLFRTMHYRRSRLPNVPIRTQSGIIPGPDYPSNWHEIRKWVLQRDGYQCTNMWQDAYGNWHRCPNRDHLHMDHIIPKSKGGSDTVDNLRMLCERCHSMRPEENHLHMRQQYMQNHPEEFGYQPQVYPYYPYAYLGYQYGYG